jgi:general secretion pathway protein C
MLFLESLKKYFWVGRLLTVALCAYLSANAVSIYLRGAFVGAPALALPAASAAALATKGLNDYDIVLKRSLFNSAGVNMEASFTKKDLGPQVTAEDMTLLGVIAGEPEDSYAVIATKHDGKTEVYRVGEKVGGDAEIMAIRAREVEVLAHGSRQVIKLPELDEAGGLAKLAERWSKGTGEQVAEGIKKLGNNEFAVDKEVIEGAFNDMASMLRGARIMPNIENGQINGFKVMRIRKDSLYGKIGLQNGDVLHRLNSVEIKGPEDGLRLFQELRNAKNISIDVTRNGKRQTLTYSVK